MRGDGTPKALRKGLVYLTKAASKGNDWAAFRLGNAFAEGCDGLSVDLFCAREWLQASVTDECDLKLMHEDGVRDAKDLLEEVTQRLKADDVLEETFRDMVQRFSGVDV